MVLEMLPNAWQSRLNGNAGGVQHVLRPNTAVHQNGWAADRTARQQDLLADLDRLPRGSPARGVFDLTGCQVVRRGAVTEDQARDEGIGKNLEVRARGKGIDVRGTGVRARKIYGVDR